MKNDFSEVINKLNGVERLQAENEELKRRLAEAEQAQPQLTIESTVVQAFRQSPEYMQLETQAFYNFLQERFIKEFERSPQAQRLVEVAQERFKVFEENYNKKPVTKTKKEEATDDK